MPIYIYECKSCNNSFEELLSLKDIDKPLQEPCPFCNEKGNIKKKIGEVTNIWKVDSATASSKFNKNN